jgi:hypothetical protein
LECLHQLVVRNTIFRKAPPSVVSGYGKRSINLNKVVANFEKHIFLSQTVWRSRREYISEAGNVTKYKRKGCIFTKYETTRSVVTSRLLAAIM